MGSHELADKPARILLVEDCPDLRQLWNALFENEAFVVNSHGNACGAIRTIETGEPFDAVVTDYFLPDMNGLDLIERVRESRPEVPCVLVTGNTDEMLMERMGRIPRSAFVRKPVKFSRLVSTVRSLL